MSNCNKYLLFLVLVLNISCAKQRKSPLKCVFVANGKASWYGPGFQGKTTASGVKFDMNELTAAHRQLEFGTLVRVTNILNGKKVVLEINDRGPAPKKRVIDLSKSAAKEIGIIETGLADVKIEITGYTETYIKTLLKHYNNILMSPL